MAKQTFSVQQVLEQILDSDYDPESGAESFYTDEEEYYAMRQDPAEDNDLEDSFVAPSAGSVPVQSGVFMRAVEEAAALTHVQPGPSSGEAARSSSSRAQSGTLMRAIEESAALTPVQPGPSSGETSTRSSPQSITATFANSMLR